MTTYSALKFDKGMTPKVFTKDSATRIEHFDTITEVLRPFRTLIEAPHNQGGGVTTAQLSLRGFELHTSGALYAVGLDHSSGTTGAIYKWSTSAFEWQDKQSMGGTLVPTSMLHSHAGSLFGLVNGTHLYKFTEPSTFDMTFYAVSYTNFADAITHSKDGVMYFATDNKIQKIPSTGLTPGAGLALALTLPNTNFRITSISEAGNFINIVGYDTKSAESSSLLWDRDTSVVDLTESFGLGRDYAIHNPNLLGTQFFIQIRQDTSNSGWIEKPVIIIKYLNGNIPTLLYEFPVESISAIGNLINCKYTSLDRFYFTAKVKFTGESAARNVCLCLDYKGRLTIAQNIAIDTGTSAISGVMRDGEAFWFGASGDSSWSPTSTGTYTTVASFETNDIRSEDLFMNIDFQTAVITCEPLPASGQIVLKASKDGGVTWSNAIGTYVETGRTKFKVNALKAKNVLTGLDRAKQVRFRLESTVGATITGFQAIFNDVKDLDA